MNPSLRANLARAAALRPDLADGLARALACGDLALARSFASGLWAALLAD